MLAWTLHLYTLVKVLLPVFMEAVNVITHKMWPIRSEGLSVSMGAAQNERLDLL